MKNTTFESIGGTYKMTNDCLIPDLSIAESAPLGKWGLLRKHYLMDNHKALYSSWMLTGELDKHLAQIEQEAQKRFDQIVVELSVQRGITEKLKAEDQLRWVREMNAATKISSAGFGKRTQRGPPQRKWFWKSSFIRWRGKRRNRGKSSRGLTRSTICRLFLMQIS